VTTGSAEKSRKSTVFHKEKRSKKERRTSPDGKEENAMRLRFPLSHRAHYKRLRKTTRERTGTEKENGLSTAIIDQSPRPTPQFLIVATPQF
jgi:hypothetical protein